MIRKQVFGANLVLILFLISSCSTLGLPNLFQSDPVGSTLFTMKTAYEGSVKSMGNAYIAGQVNDAQLKSFVVEAKKFYTSYNTVLELHKANKLEDPVGRIDALQKSLDQLQVMVQGLLIKKPAATQSSTIEYLPHRYAVRI